MRLSDLRLEVLDEIILPSEMEETLDSLCEGAWFSGRFDNNIRADQATHLHGIGQEHSHIYGRQRNELGVAHFDGTGSHGTKMKLHRKDAAALRNRGYNIPQNNIVEWVVIPNEHQILFG